MGQAADYPPAPKQAVARILDPPLGWCQVVDDFLRLAHQGVCLPQTPCACGHGRGVFRAWWARSHQVKISRLVLTPVLPVPDVCHHIGV